MQDLETDKSFAWSSPVAITCVPEVPHFDGQIADLLQRNESTQRDIYPPGICALQ